MERQRGFTLIEVLIAVGIISIVTASSIGLAQSSRSEAVATAALRFDTLLDAARTTAHEFDRGATIVFARDAAGDGFTARLYRNRPSTGPLVTTTLPLLEARVAITETAALNTPPFALTIHGDGAIAGISGYTSGATSAETGCPPSGAFHLVFAYGGTQKERYIPCHANPTPTGPISYMTPLPAMPQALPTITPCIGGTCNTLPIVPSANTTCPPSYVASSTVGSCVPAITATPSVTPTPGGAFRPKRLSCDQQNPPRALGSDLGLDRDGVNEDISDGTWCGPAATPTPSPSQIVPKIVEIQSWSAYIGARGIGSTLVDSEYFTLFDNGGGALGAPPFGTPWACPSPAQVTAPLSVTWWAGFYRADAVSSPATLNPLSTRWSALYQEVSDTGGDGSLVISDMACVR